LEAAIQDGLLNLVDQILEYAAVRRFFEHSVASVTRQAINEYNGSPITMIYSASQWVSFFEVQLFDDTVRWEGAKGRGISIQGQPAGPRVCHR
jgi:hypothetical protein